MTSCVSVGVDPSPCLWGEPRGDLHPLRILPPEADPAVHAGFWRGRSGGGRRRRGHCSEGKLRRTDEMHKTKMFEHILVLQAGDRVFTTATESGGYAEFAVAADDCVHKLPDALDFSQGAAIGIPYFTAYRALVHK